MAISYWHPWGGDYCDFAQKVIDDFNASQDKITAENVCLGGQNFDEKLITAISGGNPPDMANSWSPALTLAQQGALLALDEYYKASGTIKEEDFYPASWASCVFKNQIWAMPSVSGPSLIYYAKKLFREAGISEDPKDFPTDWAGVRALAKKLTKKDSSGKYVQVGYAPWKYGVIDLCVWAAGNGVMHYDTQAMVYHFDDPAVADVLVEWRKYIDEIFEGDAGKADDVSWTGWNSGAAPDSGWMLNQVGMVNGGHWDARGYHSFDPDFEFGMAKYPIGPKGTKSFTKWSPCWWILPQGCAHPQEGWNLIEYWELEGLKTWQRLSSDMSPRLADFEIVPDSIVELFGDKAAETWQWWTELVKDAVSYAIEPNAAYMGETVQAAIDAVILDNKDPVAELKIAQEKVTQNLQEVLGG